MPSGHKETCPECGGHNLYVTPHNGLKYCFNCGYRNGRSQNSAAFTRNPETIQEIRDYYDKCVNYYASCMSSEAYVYLRSRGITDTTIKQRRIGFCPDTHHSLYDLPIAKTAGISTGRNSVLHGRIIFPYLTPTGQVVDLRGRALAGDVVKYKGPFGSAFTRGADEWPYGSETVSGSFLVTEGEIKAIVATQHGFPAVGLPGINTWKWRTRELAEQPITIVFDSQKDTTVSEAVYQAVDKLASRLNECKVATLPLMGKTKMDLDEFVLTSGLHELKLVLDKALPYETWAQLLRRPSHAARHRW
jgi:DNA primase